MRLSGDHCSPGTTPSKPTGMGCCLCQHFHSFYNCSPTARPSASYSWRLSLIVYGMGNDVREVTESMPGRPSQVLGTERRQLPPFSLPGTAPKSLLAPGDLSEAPGHCLHVPTRPSCVQTVPAPGLGEEHRVWHGRSHCPRQPPEPPRPLRSLFPPPLLCPQPRGEANCRLFAGGRIEAGGPCL